MFGRYLTATTIMSGGRPVCQSQVPRRASWASLCVLAISLGPASAVAQSGETGPNVLIVVAHPDDDAMFAATVYKITHSLKGNVDLALVTDGSGGYQYSHLAEPIYGLDLTDERVARQHLPAIRKQELMAGGEIVGIRNYFFLDQFDHQFTENADTVLKHVWDADAVRSRLQGVMTRSPYDFVFVHLPIPNFHGHHKAASILALEAAQMVDTAYRPIVLGSFVGGGGDVTEFDFEELEGFPITKVRPGVKPFVFDRTEPLSEDGRLDYQIVVNWLIAEHKSQGTMQLLMNQGARECYWYFDANDPEGKERVKTLFDALKVKQ